MTASPTRSRATPLTPQRARVYAIVRERIERTGVAPTYAEIAADLGRSKVTVYGLVQKLVEAGLLVRTGERHAARGIGLPASSTISLEAAVRAVRSVLADHPALADASERALRVLHVAPLGPETPR